MGLLLPSIVAAQTVLRKAEERLPGPKPKGMTWGRSNPGPLGGQILPPREVPTPFGKVNLPAMEVPRRGVPHVDARRKKALRHAVATDLTGVLGLIPYVGGLVGGQLGDLHFAEMKKILTPQELDNHIKADKQIPSNGLALLYSFVR